MDAADTQIHVALQRDVGRLEGKVDSLVTTQTNMATQHERFGEKLDTILAYIEREKGSKRTWGTVVGVGGTVAGAIGGALLTWFTGK